MHGSFTKGFALSRPAAISVETSLHAQARVRYWRHTRRLTLALLLAWIGVTVTVSYFARELDFVLAGWPLSYWAAAEGALVVYVVIVAAYAWVMDRLEDACHAALAASLPAASPPALPSPRSE